MDQKPISSLNRLAFLWTILLSLGLHALLLILPGQNSSMREADNFSLTIVIQKAKPRSSVPKSNLPSAKKSTINNSSEPQKTANQKPSPEPAQQKPIVIEKPEAVKEPGLHFRALESIRSGHITGEDSFINNQQKQDSIIMNNLKGSSPTNDTDSVQSYRSLSGVNEVKINGQCFEFDDIDPLDDRNIGGAYWRHKRCHY